MNNKRRKKISEAASLLDAAFNILDAVKDDETYTMDNIPENLEGSFMYEKIENAVEKLEDALRGIEDVRDLLDEASE